MADRKNTGRITQDRKVFKRPRSEAEATAVQDVRIAEDTAELPPQDQADDPDFHEKIAAALKTLDLPDYHVTEITAIDMFEVDGQTVIQLKSGDFVKIAMVAPDEEETSAENG